MLSCQPRDEAVHKVRLPGQQTAVLLNGCPCVQRNIPWEWVTILHLWCVCVCVCVHACVRACVRVCASTMMCLCVCMHIYIYIYMCVCVCVCVCACMYVCLCVFNSLCLPLCALYSCHDWSWKQINCSNSKYVSSLIAQCSKNRKAQVFHSQFFFCFHSMGYFFQ